MSHADSSDGSTVTVLIAEKSAAATAASPDDAFAVWEADVWDGERAVEAAARLASTGRPMPRSKTIHFASRITQYWDVFYRHHGTNFFKDRHYLEADFPALLAARDRPFSLLEFGCGVGNAFFPVLARLPHLYVTAFDLSPKAVSLINASALCDCHVGTDSSSTAGAHCSSSAAAAHCALHRRLCAFVHNAVEGGTFEAVIAAHAAQYGPDNGASRALPTEAVIRATAASAFNSNSNVPTAAAATSISPATCSDLGATQFDAVLMLFVLSALEPRGQRMAFAEASLQLKPGGLLLFRDYGVFDEAELRFSPGEHRLGAHLFVRTDGTMAAYFSTSAIGLLAATAGLEVVELRYLFRRYFNRGLGTSLRRVFIQAVLRKPVAPSFACADYPHMGALHGWWAP